MQTPELFKWGFWNFVVLQEIHFSYMDNYVKLRAQT